ncbi:hypothetical protein Arnit_2022 [Arcobacter nitrofigilis DSM 7299]|uniref:Rhodanese domain-containing protein n=1 Tax=Arcobacter nitrofigilis (strain ATCC 33309 / DSM 7299 / CCUG 15893 / LMG 7604 / NCTC 12251 / CI) TaxID=572480 RepID=D5V064_ARCNC|nr:hypothetical protein [Arcobacter nitrofigilis]ADG93676.1 hypothetical protein Arnit_2022 [Arcobacter nitrofigilis DSM 7299]
MKIKLLQVILMFLAYNYMEADNTFAINTKQIEEMRKTNILYVIGVDEKSKWNDKKVKVKNFQSIEKGLLKFKVSELDFTTYKKDTNFVIFSKNDSTSIEFVQKLRILGFENVNYLKNGDKGWNEILINFRGIKLFSMFHS